MEIFIINYLVIRDENIEPLFEGALQNRINSFLGDDMKFNKLVEACFASNLDGLSDPEETKDQYRKIIQIAFSNYEKDFDYLNAHKH